MNESCGVLDVLRYRHRSVSTGNTQQSQSVCPSEAEQCRQGNEAKGAKANSPY